MSDAWRRFRDDLEEEQERVSQQHDRAMDRMIGENSDLRAQVTELKLEILRLESELAHLRTGSE